MERVWAQETVLLMAGLRAKLWGPSYLLEWCGAVTMCNCEKVIFSGLKLTVKFQSHSPVEQKCVVTHDHAARNECSKLVYQSCYKDHRTGHTMVALSRGWTVGGKVVF